MKNFFYVLLGIIIINFAGIRQTDAKETSFYISTSGNDSWSGKSAQPNPGKTDGPFATVQKALGVVKNLKKAGTLPKGGINIYIRGGKYIVTDPINLTGDESGTKDSPVTLKNFNNEDVHFIGGKILNNFEPLVNPDILKRFDTAAKDKIVQTGLKDAGITEFGTVNPFAGPRMELFFKNKYMTIARYPNNEWLKIADVPQSGEKLINPGLDRDILSGAAIPRGKHYGRFSYEGDRPDRWADSDDIWMHGFWVWDWNDDYQKIKSIDKENKEIYPAEPYHHYGYTKGQRFYFVNILEELDSPGEWYLDRKTGILYFWPPEKINDGDVMISVSDKPLISLNGTSYITVEGIIFECGKAGAVAVSQGTWNKIAGCVFRNFGSEPVSINGGTHNGIKSCDIYDVSGGGISLSGGDRKTLTYGYNYADNNHIHDYSKVYKTNRPAFGLNGVGNTLSHNYIHDAPHAGVYFYGNENILEYNEVHDIALETGDVGAFYIGRNWTVRGNIVRYNYFHDLLGPGHGGVMAVYLDDAASGMTIYGNVFYKAGRAAFIGGGHDNIVENNIFVDCNPSVHIDARGLGWAKIYIVKEGSWDMYKKLAEVDYKNPPYSTKYPKLSKILDEGDPAIPRGNEVLRNISVGGKWIELDKNIPAGTVFLKDNFVDKDPLFVDKEHGNFQLRDDSPVYKLGFKKIPVEKIGLYKDEYRKTLPEKRNN